MDFLLFFFVMSDYFYTFAKWCFIYLINPNLDVMTPEEYFSFDKSVYKKRYDALRTFFVDMLPAAEVATSYGYTLASFYSLIRDFRKHLNGNHRADFFFKDVVLGRKPGKEDELRELIINLRKKYFQRKKLLR